MRSPAAWSAAPAQPRTELNMGSEWRDSGARSTTRLRLYGRHMVREDQYVQVNPSNQAALLRLLAQSDPLGATVDILGGEAGNEIVNVILQPKTEHQDVSNLIAERVV